MYDFGLKLRELRKSKSMTQKRLAEMLGVTETVISKYEANISYPPFESLRALSAVLGVSLDELCGTQARETASLYNLTKSQQQLVKELIEEFRSSNERLNKKLTAEQYELIGKITAEFTA